MSKPRSGAPRRVAVGLMAGALATFGLAFASPAAFAVEDVTTDRLNGENRWETSQLTAAEGALAGATTAIVASGDNDHLIDSLSAAGIAGDNAPAPIIVTNGDELQPETEAALQTIVDNGGTGVSLLGGAAAVSEAVEAEIEALGLTVTRLEGADRWGTAVAAADAMGTIGEVNGMTTAVIANGFGNAFSPDVPIDALAASSIAYSENLPVLLTMTDNLIDDTAAAIEDLGIEQVIIAGGSGAVSDDVQTELEDLTGNDAIRLGGTDRWATAAAINEFAIDELGYAATSAILANGQSGVDALGAGPLAGELGAPIVLALSDLLPEPSETFLDDHSDTIAEIIIAGGEEAVGDVVVTDAVAAAETTDNDVAENNQSLAVTPAEAATNTVSTDTTNTGARTYTVSGLDNAKTYDIELHEAADVNVDEDGNVTLDNNTPIAAGDVSIETVNGLAQTNATNGGGGTYTVDNVTPQNGTIVFSVDSVDAISIVPLVNEDTDGDNTVDVATGTAPTAPTEPFGVGGQKTWIPAEAASGQPLTAEGDFDVQSVDTANDFFVAEDDASAAAGTAATFLYDANDVFQIATAASGADGDDVGAVCVQTSMETFEQNLSVADEIDVSSNYNADPAFQSTFCLEDLNPAAPTAVNATASGNNVTVTWTAAATATSYNIYRATDPTPGDACPEDGGTAIPAASYQKVGSSTTTSFSDPAVANGSYCYIVTAVSGADENALGAGASDEDQVVTPVADVTAPDAVANAAAVNTDTGFNDVADTGDSFLIHFTEAVTVAEDVALLVVDGGGDTAQIDTSNATFGVSGTTLTVTLTATPADTNAGTGDNILNYALTISNSRGLADSSGNAATFTDNSLEDDGPEFYAETADAGDTTFTVTFNEPLNEAAAETVTNWTYDPDGGGAAAAEDPASATLGADGRTVTFTVTTAVAAGATLDPEATVIDTEGQAATQGATAIA